MARRHERQGRSAEPAGAGPAVERPSKKIDVWIGLLLLALTLAVYLQVHEHTFIRFDDPDYVQKNAHVSSGLTASGIAWAFTSSHAGNWIPLTWISLMADCQLFGVDSGADLIVNALLHALTTALLFAVLKRATGAVWRSAFVAFLFGLHPLHVESVAWVAERKDVLCAFFWMLTLWAYLRYVERPSARRYALAAAGCALALLSKPMAVTLPLTLLLLDVWPLRRIGGAGQIGWRQAIQEKLPFVALSIAASAATFLAQRGSQYVMSLDMVPISTRVANAVVSYGAYLAKLFWPVNLAVMYPYAASIPVWQIAGGAVCLIGASVASVVTFKRQPYLAVGWAWYVATLFPVIGLVQVGSQARADRYMYIPSIGIFMIAAWGAADLAERWPRARLALAGLCAAACAACAPATWIQIQYWQDTETLFRHSLDLTRGDYLGHWILGVELREKGRTGEAIWYLTESTKLHPGFPDAHRDLSQLLIAQGRSEEAIRELESLVRLEPLDAEAHYNLGTTLAGEDRVTEAAVQLQEAVKLRPDYVKARLNLGSALATLGRFDEAIGQINEALRLEPDSGPARQLLSLAVEAKREAGGRK